MSTIRLLLLGLVAGVFVSCGGGGGETTTEPVLPTTFVQGWNPLFFRSISNTGVIANPGFLQVGDDEMDADLRGLLRFQVGAGALPDGSTIIKAELFVSQTRVIGTPYADLGNLFVEQVALGSTVGPEDYASVALGAARTFSTDVNLEQKVVDVTSVVTSGLAVGTRTFDFRFLFPAQTDNDQLIDCVELENAQSLPAGVGSGGLRIEFSPPD
jgi:hypothetical protein